MSLDDAQKRLERRRERAGIKREPRKAVPAAQPFADRLALAAKRAGDADVVDDLVANFKADPVRHERAEGKAIDAAIAKTGGRRVRCVECGHECRVHTNRRRRLRLVACPNCLRGRLRPLRWFTVEPAVKRTSNEG